MQGTPVVERLKRGGKIAAALQALYDWGSLHGRAEGVRFRTDIEAAA